MFNIKKITIDLASRLPLINRLLKKKTEKVFRTSAPIIIYQIRDVVEEWIESSDTIKSLRGGELQAEFGLTNEIVEQVIEQIKVIWSKSIKYTVAGGANSSSLLIYFGPRDPSSLLEIDGASYVSPRSGERIDWLKWLLLEADKIRIVGWWTMYKPAPTSRSGQAIMVKGKSRFWSVPSPFNVPSSENFIYEIMNNPAFRSQIRAIIMRVLD